ncbi:pilus assembly FimT family protein [Elongatibacter sediminis]|uniref:General secretion pathway GspH domain-containing protein n=1 Tax=Elongatibacter sediminis TaxID=3119006 RepID=A0AAW9RG76_9GAMM
MSVTPDTQSGCTFLRTSPRCRDAGITALEWLLVVSVIAILFSFTPVLLGKLHRAAALDQAVDAVYDTVTRARQTARMYHTEVILHVDDSGPEGAQSIRLEIPAMRSSTVQLEVEQVFTMPSGYIVNSDPNEIRFNAFGTVQSEISAEVVSTQSDSDHKDLLIF